MYQTDRTDTTRSSGGVDIVTARTLPARDVPLSTCVEAVARQICGNHVMTVCSLYLPPSVRVVQRQPEDLINQLPPTFLLLGDFSAHHFLWGGSRTGTEEEC